ncbi:MAG: hypothetical protein HeimC3_21070 [Candidatus Heimdallarchaeota archaeon LC_3]|nr:MAG: hypothetical protein HeimC3_21070 [Candidatus Heimdallarchaeota archaeon LC_3]
MDKFIVTKDKLAEFYRYYYYYKEYQHGLFGLLTFEEFVESAGKKKENQKPISKKQLN